MRSSFERSQHFIFQIGLQVGRCNKVNTTRSCEKVIFAVTSIVILTTPGQGYKKCLVHLPVSERQNRFY